MDVTTEEIRVAQKVVGQCESLQRELELERQRNTNLRRDLDNTKREMAAGAIRTSTRSWTAEQVEELRKEWVEVRQLLGLADDAFDFVLDYVEEMRPTARRAIIDIRTKIKEKTP